MAEWPTFAIGAVCEFTNGFAFKSTDYVDKSESTVEVFRMGYIARGGGFKEDNTPVYVPRKYSRNIQSYYLRKNDVLIAMTDMKNNVAILANTALVREDERFVVNQRVGRIRVSNPQVLDPIFFYFYSNWQPHVDYLRSRANSGVQVNLSTSAIKEAKITIPALPVQQAIASVLGALDDKIDLNRRMNETLEAMARAIFKDWFVDFGPTRAKMEGRSPYLAPEIWALFPGSFDESDQGEIPKGWRLSRLGDEVEAILGGTPSRSEPTFWGGDIPWINSGKANEFRIIEPSEFITQTGLRSSATKVLPERTTVIAITGATLGQVSITEIATCANQSVVGVPGTAAFPSEFIYFWVKENIDRLISSQTGGAQQHINKNNVNELPILCPSAQIVNAYVALAHPVFDRITVGCLESRTLAALRNTLLPKLMSGEIRVKDAEKSVEAAQ
jgi:type I restriction enzyme S subunit